MSLIGGIVKAASKLHPRPKKTWANISVQEKCKNVAAWSLNDIINFGAFDLDSRQYCFVFLFN